MPPAPTPIIVAKRPVPGRVKTRLIGRLSPLQAARIHAAMLQCVLDRVHKHLPDRFVLAIDGDPQKPINQIDKELDVELPDGCEVIDQGTGDLGGRLAHAWQQIGSGPAVFFGVDSPDAPKQALRGLQDDLNHADAAIGPVDDGGYWCLAARRYTPHILTGIDWGTSAVYHQTLNAAQKAGLTTRQVQPWHDVDNPQDLDELQQRLRTSDEPALAALRKRLDRITQDHSP